MLTLSFVPSLGAVAIWTGNTVVTKAAAGVIAPAAIAFYRWVLAFGVLAPFVGRAVWVKRAVVLAHLPRLALLGCLGMALYQSLAYVAAQTTTAVNMAVELALMPLIAALLARVFGAEPLPKRFLLGAVVSLLGLIILTTRGHPFDLLQGAVRIGDAFMLIGVSASALYGVLIKRWPMALTRWQQLFVQIGFGLIVLLPFWLLAPQAPITSENAGLILYAGIAASIGAPFLWMMGIERLGAARNAMFMNLQPPLVALGAAVLLGEALHPYHLIGGALALSGAAFGVRR